MTENLINLFINLMSFSFQPQIFITLFVLRLKTKLFFCKIVCLKVELIPKQLVLSIKFIFTNQRLKT